MALYATNRFAGDGVTTSYEFNFVGKYLARSHVKAYQEDNATKARTPVAISGSNFLNDTTLHMLPVTPVGKTLVIYRDTPKAPLVNFVNGSRFTEYNLDTATRQGAFIAAEGADASLGNVAESADRAEAAAQIAAGASAGAITAKDQAVVAATEATVAAQNNLKSFDSFADATTGAILLQDGTAVEVSQDETRAGARTRYKVQAGGLVFVVNLDQTRLDLANDTGPSKGAAMVGGASQVVASIAALRVLLKTSASKNAFVAGYYAPGDGGGGAYYYDAADTTSADNGGTVIVAIDGGRWKLVHSGIVSDKQFGAVGDMVADDTVAIQKAIDYCNSFPEALSLGMTGVCRITSPLVINRQVDTTQTDFNVIGLGKGGFYVDTQISIFTSTLPGTACSEFITFNGVVFLTPTFGLGATVLTSKFLRVQAINCTFERILFANFDTTYAQTFRFSNCRIRAWEGVFFNTRGSYDIDFDGNIIEHGGSLFRSVDPSGNTGSLGNRFRGNLIEGLSGIAITQNVTRGLDVSGNYTELNMGQLLALNYDLFPQYGINFSGNMAIVPSAKLADPEFFVVQWGATATASSSGNYTDGRLHDNKSMTGPLEASGDVAEIALFRGNGTGITDASRGGAIGTVFGVDKNSKILYVTNGYGWSGIDPTFGAFVTGPVANDSGTLVPIRIMVGAVNPQSSPASYGNPFWALGSRVFHSNPAIGQPKGWICTGSGRPGTWVGEGTL